MRLQVPATIFVTRRWLDANPAAVRELLAHPVLFEMENHGGRHGAAAVARRLREARPGDIVIAHLNRPASGTAEGLAAALPELLARDLRFVRPSQAAGVQPATCRGPAR